MGKRALVTGATGFVGSHLCKRLQEDGYELFAVGINGENKLSVDKFLHLNLDGFNFDSLPNIDICFHQAANNDTTDLDQKNMIESNVFSPLRLFKRLFYEKKCRHFVYASSCSVYGNQPIPFHESKTKIDPLNPYALSKIIFEEEINEFANKEDIIAVGLRYSNVYGMNETHKKKRSSMISQLLHTMIKKERPKIFEFGEQKRDWVYIEDIVQANILAANYNKTDVFNAGCGESASFNEIILYINKFIDDNLEPIYIKCPFLQAYQSQTLVDLDHARSNLGYHPAFSVENGIKDFIAQIKKDTI